MIKVLKGAFAVVVLAVMTGVAARQPEGPAGNGTFAINAGSDAATAGGPFQELFGIAGKWPFVALMVLVTVYAAFAVWREFRKLNGGASAPQPMKPSRSAPLPPLPQQSAVTPATGYSADRIAKALGAAREQPPQMSAADQQLVKRMLDSMVAQVQHEQDMVAARGHEPVSVRLVPQVPLRDRAAPKGWLGGGACLPPEEAWPTQDGVALQLLAQIDCSALPPDLWEGQGPRQGWLTIFINPKTGAPFVRHFAIAGAYRASPALEPDCVIVGYDMRPTKQDERPSLIPAFPRWPVDVVAVRPGQADPHKEGSSDILHRRYAAAWDITEPRFHPFDWPSAQMLMELALRAADKRLADHPVPDRLTPEAVAAQQAKYDAARAAGESEDSLLRMKASLDEQRVSRAQVAFRITHGAELRAQVRALRQQVDEMASSLPFAPSLMAPVLAEMKSLQWMSKRVPPLYRNGKELTPRERAEEGAEAYLVPITSHDRDGTTFANSYVTYLQDRAKHLYAEDPSALPYALRADCEEIWKDRAAHEMGGMGHVPWNYVHAFDADDVTLLELPSSQLLNWQFGDVDHLVLTLKKADLAQGRFDRVRLQISN